LGLLRAPRGPRWGLKGVKKEVLKIRVATSNPQKHKKSFQEAPKSAQNEAKRAQEQFKEHLYTPNLDLSKM